MKQTGTGSGTLLWVAVVAAAATGLACASSGAAPASSTTWGEKLGYGTKPVLIRHADDGGMFPAGNQAIIDGLTGGWIDSASAMPPLHFFDPMIDWYRAHSAQDVGIHLTFTSEWTNYKWGPVAPTHMVKRILTKEGVFKKRELPGFFLARAPNTVGEELQAQINRTLVAMNPSLIVHPDEPDFEHPCIPPTSTLRAGFGPPPQGWKLPPQCLAPTHVDSHMVSLYTRKVYFKKFIGRTLKNDLIPLTFEEFDATTDCLTHGEGPDFLKDLINKHHFSRLAKAQRMYSTSQTWPYRRPFPRVDRYCKIPYGNTYEATRDNLEAFLQELSQKPGITQLLFHPTYESSLLKIAATGSWQKRVWDTMLFKDAQITPFFQGVNPQFQTTTWREMTVKCQAASICP